MGNGTPPFSVVTICIHLKATLSNFVFQAKQGLGDYLNQLARATQVQRLLERYIALAPGVNVIKLFPFVTQAVIG
jgi:hypothetical protein